MNPDCILSESKKRMSNWDVLRDSDAAEIAPMSFFAPTSFNKFGYDNDIGLKVS